MEERSNDLHQDEIVKYAVRIYSENRHKYDDLCEETKRIVVGSFKNEGIPYHIIEARSKAVASFEKKSLRKHNLNEYKYNSPLDQITDLSGVRIITYTLKDVDRVCEFISKNFEIIEKKDVGEERFKDGKFGYQSIHFLIRYPMARLNLPDFSRFQDMICEIQVRTVLQHAWAEIEHDIQYKNQSGLPTVMQRKFIALAGLLEIADREFQTIQDDDQSLKSKISESLQEELTRGAIAGKATSGKDSKDVTFSEEVSVRSLVRQGKYDEAIQLYDEKVKSSPSMHTLYLGRAKVRFLSGDRAGALADIDEALELNPNDSAALRLRGQVREGTYDRTQSSLSEANELSQKAHEHLEAGDGVAAFEFYSLAQQEGASKPFSIINKSMSCFLAMDFDGAKYLLGSLEIRPGTTMAATIVAMYCIVYAVSNSDKYDHEVIRLQEILGQCETYNFNISPLSRLARGMINWSHSLDPEVNTKIEYVFAHLGKKE